MRLQKYLSQCGAASRREAESMIAAGRIRVNGQTVDYPGCAISEGDIVELDGTKVSPPACTRTVMLNKPTGVITSAKDPQGRTTVIDLINCEERLFPVGRLDYETSGLLLLTNDGALAHALTHPSRMVEKRYLAYVRGNLTQEAVQTMERGLVLDDGHVTSPARVEIISRNKSGAQIRVSVHEGYNRLIRRMCKAVGCPVMRLSREAVGPLSLGNLKNGAWRDLTPEELDALRKACAL